jgi:hypothetical protein
MVPSADEEGSFKLDVDEVAVEVRKKTRKYAKKRHE